MTGGGTVIPSPPGSFRAGGGIWGRALRAGPFVRRSGVFRGILDSSSRSFGRGLMLLPAGGMLGSTSGGLLASQ